MKKNISSLLQRGNLTPKERYILLIQNDIEETQDAIKKGESGDLSKTKGKGFLSEADKEALANWTAKNNEEAKEWNRYNEGWKLTGRMGIEAEMIYMQTLAENYRKNIVATQLIIYPSYRNAKLYLEGLKKIKVVDINEAVAITNEQREQKLKDGLDFDYATHQLAFESLSDEIRQDILTLDQEAEYEPSYLEDEETIANLLNGKDELTKEAKEKYAELVASRSYNNFAKEYQLHGAFASLPIMDIAKKWAKDKGIKPRQKDYERYEKMIENIARKKGILADEKTKDKIYKELKEKKGGDKDEWLLEEVLKEILEDYARDNKTTIKKILKETLLKWLEEGLPYPPLVISKDRDAYNGKTKLPHDELFKEWIKAKEKARETLQKLIDKDELKVREQTPDETEQDRIFERGREKFLKHSDKVITGESLYNFKGDFEFVKEFKERVDKYNPNLGLVYADDDPEHKGDHLDQELLIAERDKDGKPSIISEVGKSVKVIESVLDSEYFKETTKDGETYLEFKSEGIKEAFTSAIESIKDGYAKLLAFQEIFKKLNKIYEAETDHLLRQRLEQVSEFIDLHNAYVEKALAREFILTEKPQLKTKENLYIEKEKIAPHKETLEEWKQKFSEVFSDF